MIKKYRSAGILAAIFVLLAVCVWLNREEPTYIKYVDFERHVAEGEVEKAEIGEGTRFRFSLYGDGTAYSTDNPRNPLLKENLLKAGIEVSEGKYSEASGILQIAFFILLGIAAFSMTYPKLRRGREMAAQISEDLAEEAKGFGFSDVAGNEEAKDAVGDIVDFIQSPEKYEKYGARIPHGVILYGPPGTGKTLLARAVAGEAGVPFFAASGSDFVQMYVGMGAARVRELFKKARAKKKAVIFIDEIDALGKKRGVANSGNDERDQTLNALLTEMSGFSPSDGIVVIAATNRLDTLDDALLRPGRFDRQVEMGLPDLAGRRKILGLHAKNKPIARDVAMEGIAKQTVYFSGAMLENLLNEAAIFAAKEQSGEIGKPHIDKAYYTVVAGAEKSDRSAITPREREITAYHEAGHAVAARLLTPENSIAKITIIPSTRGAGGFCLNIPPDKMFFSKKEMEATLMVDLAGRAAEEIVFGADDITAGAANDIEKAGKILRGMISRYGMTEIGMVNPDDFGCGGVAFEEARKLMDGYYSRVRELIRENAGRLAALAERLLEKESLDEGEILELVS